MINKKKTRIVSGSILTSFFAQGQQRIDIAGGDTVGTGGSEIFSIGQKGSRTVTGAGIRISEGVQQHFDVLVMGTDHAPSISLCWSSFSNPSSEVLIEKAEDNQGLTGTSNSLHNSSGKLVSTAQIREAGTATCSESLANGPNTLHLMKPDKALKSFSRIKRLSG